MNEAQRGQSIKDALAAYYKKPGDKETEPLSWRGSQELFPVVKLSLDVVLLNPFSHRHQAMLEGEPGAEAVREDPWSPESQEFIAGLLKRRHRNFERLKESLSSEGQEDPGVITHQGVLFDGNTRAAALRELGNPDKQWIRVAVLPDDARPPDLEQLESDRSLQDSLKDPYELTEQLVFIEDKARKFDKTSEQIAIDFRWATEDGRSKAAGAKRVDQMRRILALIREMQKLTDPELRLTIFDDKLEQLKALEQDYNKRVDTDPGAAQAFLLNWLAAFLAGSSSAHQLRGVDEYFAGDYLIPRLEENGLLGNHLRALVSLDSPLAAGPLPGGDLLADGDEGLEDRDSETSVKPLLNLLASDEETVYLPGVEEPLDRSALKAAVGDATKLALADKKAADRVEGELDEPESALREAVNKLRKAEQAFRAVQKDKEYDQPRRSAFEYQLRQVRKQLQKLTDLTGQEE